MPNISKSLLSAILAAIIGCLLPVGTVSADRDDDRDRYEDRDEYDRKKYKNKSKHRHEHSHTRGRSQNTISHSHPHRDDHHDDDHGSHEYDDRTERRTSPVTAPAPNESGWETVKLGSSRHFSDTDRSAIKHYYRKSSRLLKLMAPPAPPPGTEKLVKRGAKVPPLIPIKHLPSKLKGKLKPAPSGYRFGSIGSAIIIYKKSSRAVYDIYIVKPR